MKVSTTALLLLCANSATALAPLNGAKNPPFSALKAQSTLNTVSVEGGYVITEDHETYTPTLRGNEAFQRPKWLVSSSSNTKNTLPSPASPVIAAAKQHAKERRLAIERDSQMAVQVKSRVAMIRERNAARFGKKETVVEKEADPVEIPAAEKATETTLQVAPVQKKETAAPIVPLSSAAKEKKRVPQKALRADPREPIGWWGAQRTVKGTYQMPRPVLPDVQSANFRPPTRMATRVVEKKPEPSVAAPQAKEIVPEPKATVATPKATTSPEPTTPMASTFDVSKTVENKSIKTVEPKSFIKTVDPKPSPQGFAKTKAPASEKSFAKSVKAVEAKPISGSGFFDKKVSLKSNVKAAEAQRKSKTAMSMAADPYSSMDWPEDSL